MGKETVVKLFAPATPLVLYSDFSPDECERRLSRSIDVERPTIFGFSGYRGKKPFLGELDGNRFRVLQRVYGNRNSLPTVFLGELQSHGTGTRVNGMFDLKQVSKIAICVFGAVGLLISIPIIMFSYTHHPVFGRFSSAHLAVY